MRILSVLWRDEDREESDGQGQGQCEDEKASGMRRRGLASSLLSGSVTAVWVAVWFDIRGTRTA
jgi:hypothetical protein